LPDSPAPAGQTTATVALLTEQQHLDLARHVLAVALELLLNLGIACATVSVR
jgi:hypothetical protein